jgi:hypothetical protein
MTSREEHSLTVLLSRRIFGTMKEVGVCLKKRRMPSSGMLRRVALVRTEVSEELNASLIRVTRIGELGTILADLSSQGASVDSYG